MRHKEAVDFVARRQAAIRAERKSRNEWILQDEFEHEQEALRYEFEARMKHAQAQRQKYEQAMAEKRR
jgi:hypothetical protein